MSEPQSDRIVPPIKGVDEIEDLFKDDTPPEKEPEKEVKDGKDVKDNEEEIEEEEEIEIKEDEEEPEKIDLKDDKIEIDTPPRKKELEAAYPGIFKKHPFLEKMLYRDKQYTELFGSFDDAREIAEQAEVFNNFQSQLLSGKSDEILKSVKDTDQKAFDKLVDDYLPALARVDKEAYFEVASNVVKRLIMDMVSEAKKSDKDELREAALLINQFMFGSSEFSPLKARSVKEDKNDEVERERLEFVRERFETSRNDLQTRVDNLLKNTINEYIDPKNQMTSFVKKNAVRDALEELHKILGEDTSLRKNLDKLWRASLDDKFSKSSLDRIQSIYLGRAKSNLVTVIKKARAEALKDSAPPKRRSDAEEIEEETPSSERRGHIPAGQPSRRSNNKKMEKGESVMDFFSRD